MNRRPTYLLLLLMLFAKSYASALPINPVSFPEGKLEKAIRHSYIQGDDKKDAVIQNPSLISDDEEEDEDYTPAFKKQALISQSIAPAILSGKGFLVQQYKNSCFSRNFHSSYPPTYLRLRVIRI